MQSLLSIFLVVWLNATCGNRSGWRVSTSFFFCVYWLPRAKKQQLFSEHTDFIHVNESIRSRLHRAKTRKTETVHTQKAAQHWAQGTNKKNNCMASVLHSKIVCVVCRINEKPNCGKSYSRHKPKKTDFAFFIFFRTLKSTLRYEQEKYAWQVYFTAK